jgi:hypothetical protein
LAAPATRGVKAYRRRRQLRLAVRADRGDGYAKSAVEIIFRADIGAAEKIAACTKEYEERFLSPFIAAERGYIDDVIMRARASPGRWRCCAGRRWRCRGGSMTICRCDCLGMA